MRVGKIGVYFEKVQKICKTTFQIESMDQFFVAGGASQLLFFYQEPDSVDKEPVGGTLTKYENNYLNHERRKNK